jgi:hypothetical protein
MATTHTLQHQQRGFSEPPQQQDKKKPIPHPSDSGGC